MAHRGLDGENPTMDDRSASSLRSSGSMKRQVSHKDMNASFIININNNLIIRRDGYTRFVDLQM